VTASRLRDVLARLRWSQRGFAQALACDDRLVRRWASGDAAIPPDVAGWLEALAEAHARHPVPEGWRRRSA
jgi:ribosome-binding protein aMBF1 (putative translation factor)